MKKLGFLGLLLIMAGVVIMGNLTGCDTGTSPETGNETETGDESVVKSNPIQVYSTNDGSTTYTGADLDLYFDGDPQKNTVAEIRSGKVTFIYTEVPANLLQTATVGQNSVSAVNPVGAKIAIQLKLTSDSGEELVLQKDGSRDTVSIIYADRDVSVTFNGSITINLKKGWNFVFVNTGETKQDPEGFAGHHWVLN
jgi:hypothetical protein